MPNFASNREAFHNYEILEKLEAGIQLTGPEVKSVKGGNISLKGSYAVVHDNELRLINMHIGLYKPAALLHQEPDRSRRLLVHRSDIDRFIGKIRSSGLTLVPLSVYSKNGLIKVELGLGRGKKAYDKRQSIKKRDIKRQIGLAMRVKG